MSNVATVTGVPVPLFRHVGPWLGLLIAVFMLLNTYRALHDPVGFARYYGTALQAPQEVSFVYVYAIRAFFLAVLAFWLLFTRRLDALSIMAFAAVVMTVGDALLAHQSGAAAAIVVRHVVIGIFLVVTGVMLRRAVRAGASV